MYIKNAAIFRLFMLVVSICLSSCSENAEIIKVSFQDNNTMQIAFEKITEFHLNNGFHEEIIERLNVLSDNNPRFVNFYKQGYVDKQVSAVFNLSRKPIIEIYVYKSAFNSENEMRVFISKLIEIAKIHDGIVFVK